MRKLNILIMIALAVVMLATIASHVGKASAQQEGPVGIVIAFLPGQSITIVDQQGTPHEYILSPTVKILPEGHENSLAVGSFVTIIAPASINHDKETAVGIVVHPHVPGGWHIPTLHSATHTATDTPTPAGIFTDTPTSTLLPTDTATATETATGTALATDTATATATPTFVGTPTDTPTATPTPAGVGMTASTTTFIDWLASLFRQILTRQ